MTELERAYNLEGAADAWTAAAMLLESGIPADVAAHMFRENAKSLDKARRTASPNTEGEYMVAALSFRPSAA